MPWNCSSQVMFFNKTVFERAGLDPNKPPVTFAEYHDMAAQVKARGGVAYGAALKLSASNVEDWVAQAGSLFLNHDNGRTGRATAVAFGGPAGAQVFEFTESMLSSKIAEPILDTSYDNLFGIGNGTTAMGIDTSAALGTVLQVLRNGRYPSVVLGVGGLPGIDGPGVGVPYGGAGLYIVKGPSPERQDAAWQFVKYLLSPDAMATWAIGSGYIPITRSATTTDAIKKAWATTPQYRTAYEQVRASQATPATAGGVTGAFAQIETDLDSALSLVSNGTSGSQALAHAVSSANQAIASYNATV
jgi:sn-glycerol 3-phosphate transport system substrate-binding protein